MSSSFLNLKLIGMALPNENREFMQECLDFLKENANEGSSAQSNGVAAQDGVVSLPASFGAKPKPRHHLYPGPPPGFKAFLHENNAGLGLFYPQRPAHQLTLDEVSAVFANDVVSLTHIREFRRIYDDALLKMQMTDSNLQRFMDVYVYHLRDFLVQRRTFPVESEPKWLKMQEKMQQRIQQWTEENDNWMMLHIQKPAEPPCERYLLEKGINADDII